MHLVDVATSMQLKSTGQGATCVPFLIKGKTKMTVYRSSMGVSWVREIGRRLTLILEL